MSPAVQCPATVVVRGPLAKRGTSISFSCFYWNFTVDNAFISLRYARNLAQGYGLVFSTDGSPPVEAYTNFLQVVMETPLFLLGLTTSAILHTVKTVGIVFGVGVVVLTYSLIAIVTNDRHAASLGAVFASAFPNFAFWAVGGLETTMYLFWMLAALCIYTLEDRNGRPATWGRWSSLR